MSEKKVRNKVRDAIGDYYLTNRQISKENDDYNKENPRSGRSTQEKVLIGIIVVGVIGIIIKYLVL